MMNATAMIVDPLNGTDVARGALFGQIHFEPTGRRALGATGGYAFLSSAAILERARHLDGHD